MRHLLEDPANTLTAIEQLRNGGDKLLRAVYHLYQNEFIRWARTQSQLDDDRLKDVFQDAVIILFKKVKFEEVPSIYSSIKAFLWGIAKNVLSHKQEQEGRFKYPDGIDDALLNEWDDRIYKITAQDHLKHLFSSVLQKIGDPCKTIVTLKFYQNYDAESIAITMAYKNAQVVHAQLYRCLQQLYNMVKDKV